MFSVPLSDMGNKHHLNRQRENRVSDIGDKLLSDSLFLVVFLDVHWLLWKAGESKWLQIGFHTASVK